MEPSRKYVIPHSAVSVATDVDRTGLTRMSTTIHVPRYEMPLLKVVQRERAGKVTASPLPPKFNGEPWPHDEAYHVASYDEETARLKSKYGEEAFQQAFPLGGFEDLFEQVISSSDLDKLVFKDKPRIGRRPPQAACYWMREDSTAPAPREIAPEEDDALQIEARRDNLMRQFPNWKSSRIDYLATELRVGDADEIRKLDIEVLKRIPGVATASARRMLDEADAYADSAVGVVAASDRGMIDDLI